MPPQGARVLDHEVADGAGRIGPDMRVRALAELAMADDHVAQGAAYAIAHGAAEAAPRRAINIS